MSASSALVELVREALRDPSIRDEIRAVVADDIGSRVRLAADCEPLVDAHAAGKLLGLSASDHPKPAMKDRLKTGHQM